MGQSTERWGVRDIKQRERKRMRLNKHNFHLFKQTRIFSMKIKSDFCIKAPNGLKENANSKLRKEVKEFIGNRTIGVWIFLCYRLAGKTMSHIHILFFFFFYIFFVGLLPSKCGRYEIRTPFSSTPGGMQMIVPV